MGIGWIVVDSLENRLYSIDSLKVVNWPTSTKAELIGIQIVLLIAKCDTSVRVLTDSELAIDSIHRACNSEQYNKWIRSDNRIILERIVSLVKQKNLNLVFEKVKSHSTDLWNIKADQLAKEGRYSSTVINLERVISKDIDYEITWKTNRIENSVKQFLTKLTKMYNDANWAYSKRNNLSIII